jgi:hypothetical protein
MKANQNFKLAKPTKRILATMHGEDRTLYKKLMIMAQLHQNIVLREKKKPNQPQVNEE